MCIKWFNYTYIICFSISYSVKEENQVPILKYRFLGANPDFYEWYFTKHSSSFFICGPTDFCLKKYEDQESRAGFRSTELVK